VKIGEVEVGKEYGALDSPKRGYSRVDPRQVKVLNIVTVEESTYSNYTGARGKKNVRRVEVEVLNGPETKKEGWRWDAIERAAKGDVLVIEARQLVGPWKALNKDILERIAREEAATARKEDLERRLKALGFKLEWDSVQVTVSTSYGNREGEIEFKGKKAIDQLLNMLEAKP